MDPVVLRRSLATLIYSKSILCLVILIATQTKPSTPNSPTYTTVLVDSILVINTSGYSTDDKICLIANMAAQLGRTAPRPFVGITEWATFCFDELPVVTAFALGHLNQTYVYASYRSNGFPNIYRIVMKE